MKYRPRPGIVLTKICGSYYLIPSRIAYSDCNTMIHLPLLWASDWQFLECGAGIEQMIEVHRIFKKRPEEELRKEILSFFDNLADRGFLIREPEEDNP